MAGVSQSVELDLDEMSVRQVNAFLHDPGETAGIDHVEVLNPKGQHNIAVGVDAKLKIDVHGHAGYYAGGMNKQAEVTIRGNVERGVAENIMSGRVRVNGNASQSAGASGHGGLLIIEGDASSRCGISMKGCDIVVGGSVGHISGFMAQLGRLVVCGDAAAGLGDSLYEAVIYVRGKVAGLGADAQQEDMTEDDVKQVAALLEQAGFDHDPASFKRIASARSLYHWNADADQQY